MAEISPSVLHLCIKYIPKQLYGILNPVEWYPKISCLHISQIILHCVTKILMMVLFHDDENVNLYIKFVYFSGSFNHY